MSIENSILSLKYLFHSASQHIQQHMRSDSRCSRNLPHRLLGSCKDQWSKDSKWINIHFTVKIREAIYSQGLKRLLIFSVVFFCVQQNVHNLFDISPFSFFARSGTEVNTNYFDREIMSQEVSSDWLHVSTYPKVGINICQACIERGTCSYCSPTSPR